MTGVRVLQALSAALLVSLALLTPARRAGAAAAPAVEPFSVQDLVRLQRISDIAASPDGKSLAYTLRTTDMEANLGRTGVWLLDVRKRGAAAQRLSEPGADAKSPAWSSDGRTVYFLTNQSGTMQVWRSPTAAASSAARAATAATQVTHLPLDVGTFRLAPTADRLFVSLAVFRDCADLECTVQRLDKTRKTAAHGIVYDHLFARHWDTWADGRRSQLFALALAPDGTTAGTPVNLTNGIDGDVPGKPFGGNEDYAVSPDGRHVTFAVRVGTTGEPWSTNFDLYEVAADGGTPRNLTADNPAWDGQPAYSPDGSQLAYVAMDRAGFEADKLHLVLLDLKTGVQRGLTQSWDRSIAGFQWSSNGRTLFATAEHLGQRPLWVIDAATGRASAITGAGEVEGFSIAHDRVFFTMSTLAAPADAYAVGLGGGRAQQLTHVNAAVLAQRRRGDYEQFSFAGANDDTVYGYVVKPVGFKPGAKYPVAFVVHGGPQGSLANTWHYRWNAQSFAGAGYAVVLIDFHGSTGYGQAFTDSISHDWGGKPLEDLQRGLAAALTRYPWLDGERACALGGSYGGFMMNWIAGMWPDRFKCIVTHDGIFDNRSMYYSTEELWFPEWENGGPEYENPAAYAKFNPVDHVSRWQTPTLVVHGELDYRVPYAQGLAVFTALQRRGVPSELLFFPDENHWVLKPANSVLWYDTTLRWLNRWTQPGGPAAAAAAAAASVAGTPAAGAPAAAR